MSAEAVSDTRAPRVRRETPATRDGLTGLPNRVMLAQWLAERTGAAAAAVAAAPPSKAPAGPGGPGADPGPEAARIGLCCLDLDGFRQINALLGFAAGDRFLAAAAERLRAVTEPGGHRLARTGGDEFAVLVADSAAPGTAGRVADQILAVLRDPLHVDGRDLTLTASIGAVDAPACGSGPEDLLRAADLALYWAKGEGRDRWTMFDPERAGADVARYRLAADLPAAVEAGEFFCEYQPIVALGVGVGAGGGGSCGRAGLAKVADGPGAQGAQGAAGGPGAAAGAVPGGIPGVPDVVGVEALVRWRHPRYGVVGPDRFIGLAEESGLIVELGRKILMEACAQAATWPSDADRPAPPVSVNVAVRQLRDPRLTGHVLAALEAAGLPPGRLRLEITESALLPGDDTAAAVLRSLAERGVGIAVDDFGTGYSNLAHLRRLPVHILKIDGTFVHGLAAERPGCADEQIIATVTALGHALGLSVTAEGVETAEQLETVRRLGVDTGQGWLFSRALSADGIRALLAHGAPLAA